MKTSKVAITIDKRLLSEVDALVEHHVYPSRSRAIQETVAEGITEIIGG